MDAFYSSDKECPVFLPNEILMYQEFYLFKISSSFNSHTAHVETLWPKVYYIVLFRLEVVLAYGFVALMTESSKNINKSSLAV